ncbi:MAG: endonuclease III [Clostridia bacterium]|nr:endonuclease III [Clostridia bacterium]
MKEIVCPALKGLPKGKKARAIALGEGLKQVYPDAACALAYEQDPFHLLVMARLSAQCTDKRVNLVSRELFRVLPDARAFAGAPLEKIETLVKPCGLYHTKAKSIQDFSRILVERYGGQVPDTKEALLALPGVGEKIANLMMGDVFGDPHIVADTHCIRLSGRWKLTDSRVPEKVTRDLEKIVPKEEQSDFCHRVVDFGRDFCRAMNPDCEGCPLRK